MSDMERFIELMTSFGIKTRIEEPWKLHIPDPNTVSPEKYCFYVESAKRAASDPYYTCRMVYLDESVDGGTAGSGYIARWYNCVFFFDQATGAYRNHYYGE